MPCLWLDTIVIWIAALQTFNAYSVISSICHLSIKVCLYLSIYLHIYVIYMLLCNLLFVMICFHIKHSYAIYKKVEDYTDLQP